MAIALVDSDAVGLSVSSAGVVYNFPAGAPGANDWDLLFINSDATISTPAGWTLERAEVGGQGSYIFSRKGGAGSSVTVATVSAGPFNVTLTWSRWSGALLRDVATGVRVTGNGNASPALSSGTLATTGELCAVFVPLHSIGIANQNTPVWSSGFTPMELIIQGTGASGCVGLSGYKLNAGTAAENPGVTWSGALATDRYTLIVTFTPVLADAVSPDGISVPVTLGPPALTDSALEVDPDGITLPVTFGAPEVSGAALPGALDPVVELYTQALSCLCSAFARNPDPPQHCAPRVGTEALHDLGQFHDLCCEGLAYIMLGDTYFSSDSFPDQDIIRQIQGGCAPPAWAQVFKLGIIRCINSGGDIDGEPMSDDAWTAAAIQNMYDSQSLRQAACCLRSWVKQNQTLYSGMDVVINRQIQSNPGGGCVERYMTVTVQFPDLDCVCV